MGPHVHDHADGQPPLPNACQLPDSSSPDTPFAVAQNDREEKCQPSKLVVVKKSLSPNTNAPIVQFGLDTPGALLEWMRRIRMDWIFLPKV